MRQPPIRTTIPPMKHGLSVLLAVMVLGGCFDVETSVVLGRDGGGHVDLVYRIDEELFRLGVFDDSLAALPVPLSREDFENAADGIPGLSVRRYRMIEEVGYVLVSARLMFDSVESLSMWYGGGTDALSLSGDGSSSRWSQLIAPSGAARNEVSDSLAESLEGYGLRFELRPPERVRSANIGSVSSDGRVAVLELPLAEIVGTTSEIRWNVEW